jgi:hypothetical protein
MIWTYAGHLLDPEFDHYDRLLRSTVAWCMAHRPSDRPGIRVLEGLIMSAVAHDRSAAEAEGRVSIAELLGEPSAVVRQAQKAPLAAAAKDVSAIPAGSGATRPVATSPAKFGGGGRGGGGLRGGRGGGGAKRVDRGRGAGRGRGRGWRGAPG